jgi:hypothetical protein
LFAGTYEPGQRWLTPPVTLLVEPLSIGIFHVDRGRTPFWASRFHVGGRTHMLLEGRCSWTMCGSYLSYVDLNTMPYKSDMWITSGWHCWGGWLVVWRTFGK